MPGFELFGDLERKEVQDVLNTGVLFRYGFDQARQNQWKARSFETELANRLGIKYCHLCSSGTAALSIALAACGVGAGDEVIVPPFTFIATLEAVICTGAVPVFAEIDETLCLDPQSIEEMITSRTKAVMVVHMCGSMARIDEIHHLCKKKNFVLIEDACQSIGATFRGKALGTFGEMGCFSFDPVKTITCGEGGAVVTHIKERYLSADAFADHGHDHIGNDRGLEQHLILGNNFRISELNAAVGLAQLRRLDSILEKQRKHKQFFKTGLESISNLAFRKIPDDQGDSATFLSFFLPDETTARHLAGKLSESGVDGCFYWYDNNWHYIRQWEHLKGLHSASRLPITLVHPRPDYSAIDLPRSDHIMSRTVSMQIKLSWSKDDLEERLDKMVKIVSGL
jgi:8-amino-3,8-dideoxy-alpha-D-manno-octulosonate transaminase